MDAPRFLVYLFVLMGLFGREAEAVDHQSLGAGAVPIITKTSSGAPICNSFAFSQLPDNPNLFVSKLKGSTNQGVCAGALTLALFQFNWSTHVMTLLHPLMSVPSIVGTSIIAAAYDPSVAKFANETWVAFECTGPHIPGTSTCIAPLVGTNHIDLSRLTMPVVGLDGDTNSLWTYSASTPKLLNFKGRLYLYWTAIQSLKGAPHTWKSVSTRGTELEYTGGKMWAKGHPGIITRSNTPGVNVGVMAPITGDRSRNTAVDTEGLFVEGNYIIVLSSVGGTGPSGSIPCTRPLDKITGCFRLEITRTTDPLATDGFVQQRLVSPLLPPNPVEYPKIVTSPDGRRYLMVNTHPLQAPAQANTGIVLPTALFLIPVSLSALQFQ